MTANSVAWNKTADGTRQQQLRSVPSLALVWVTAIAVLAPSLSAVAGTTSPYYQRITPTEHDSGLFEGNHIDLRGTSDAPFHLPAYPTPDAGGALPDSRPLANALFDARAAAAVSAAIGDPSKVTVYPSGTPNADGVLVDPNALLEQHTYDADTGAPSPIYLLTAKCMAAMAYDDYFFYDGWGGILRTLVSDAIMAAASGWCGSFGPGVTGSFDFISGSNPEGNYDMNEMHIIPLIYGYYDELTPAARERVIMVLLNLGQMQRPNEGPTYTSGAAPNDWSRAGYLDPLGAHFDIPETENHVLMIATARYLANQLLYQRLHDVVHDNRRNGDPGNSVPSCTELMLSLLRNILVDDFAEYNAKPYQEETRWALLNLYSYAYDDDVRLAARMVLDYLSARFVTSSDDLRRMVPFRRRYNEGPNALQSLDLSGRSYMDFGLLEYGNDPITPYFAMLAGNTRAYETPNLRAWGANAQSIRPWPWGIVSYDDIVQQPLSDYRLPPSLHDLFVNDLSRRFFQRVHRTSRTAVPGGQYNCNNMEVYAGSPSYLITAGGSPAQWVIPGALGLFGYQDQNLGVSMPTTFMPTGLSAGVDPDGYYRPSDTANLIQFSRFSFGDPGGALYAYRTDIYNYGVAPDFACGYGLHKPAWVTAAEVANGRFTFVNKGPDTHPPGQLAGFYLAIHQEGDYALLEAFDTWRHPEVTFTQFTNRVLVANGNFLINNGQGDPYITQNGNRIHFRIVPPLTSSTDERTEIISIEYGAGDPADTLSSAGNDNGSFLCGSVLRSPREAVIAITNPFLGTTITLDMSDMWHPRRTNENGVVETAGWDLHQQVWVDFNSPVSEGPDGDVYHPYKSLTAASDNVAVGGTVNIVPGSKIEPITITKAMTLKSFPGSATISGH